MRLWLVLRGLKTPLGGYRHFVFDLDGTLVDSRRDIAEAINWTLRELGLPPLDEPTIIGFVGRGIERLVRSVLEMAAPERAPELRAVALDLATRRYSAHALDHTAPYVGVPDALRILRARGARISVLTNKLGGPARDILDRLSLGSCVDAVVGGDDRVAPKPDPEGLRSLAARAGIALGATLMVGDSDVDVDTARAAGVDACAVTWGFGSRASLVAAAPRFAIDDPAELLSLAPAP